MTAEFLVGTHEVRWVWQHPVPFFTSYTRWRLALRDDSKGGRLRKRRRPFPRALAPIAMDSGGFSQLKAHGAWTISPEEYVADARTIRDEAGGGALAWLPPQDWMCEPEQLLKTGKGVGEHQLRTVLSYLNLRDMAPDLPFIPVLQGYSREEYLRCVELYDAFGVDLGKAPLVGVGSICRRYDTREAEAIIRELSGMGLSLHGFGLKRDAFVRMAAAGTLASADSLAWSNEGRYGPPCPVSTRQNCANCAHFALEWRAKLLNNLERKAA